MVQGEVDEQHLGQALQLRVEPCGGCLPVEGDPGEEVRHIVGLGGEAAQDLVSRGVRDAPAVEALPGAHQLRDLLWRRAAACCEEGGLEGRLRALQLFEDDFVPS